MKAVAILILFSRNEPSTVLANKLLQGGGAGNSSSSAEATSDGERIRNEHRDESGTI